MHCEVSIEIPACRDVVWRIAQDPTLRPRWDVRITDYQVASPQAPGAAVTLVARIGWLRPQVSGQMLRWDPPHQSIIRLDSSTSLLLPPGAGSWTFTDLPDGGTRLTSRFALAGEQLPAWVHRGLYRWAVIWDTRRSFRRLRRLVMRGQDHTGL